MQSSLQRLIWATSLCFGALGIVIYTAKTQPIAKAQVQQNVSISQPSLSGSIPSEVQTSLPAADSPSGQAVAVPYAPAFTRGQATSVQLSRTAAALMTDPQNSNFRAATPTSASTITPQEAIAYADTQVEGRLALEPIKTTVDYVTFYDPMIQQRREAWRVVYWGSPILQTHYQLPDAARAGGLTSPGSQSVSQLAVTIVLIDPLTHSVLQISSST